MVSSNFQTAGHLRPALGSSEGTLGPREVRGLDQGELRVLGLNPGCVPSGPRASRFLGSAAEASAWSYGMGCGPEGC